VISSDDDRARSGLCDAADPLFDHFVALLDADGGRVDIAQIGDVQAVERRDFLKIAVRPDHRRLRTDFARPETCAGTIRRASVERHADERDVEAVRVLDVRQPHERGRLGEAG